MHWLLKSFNAVRKRAGLSAKASITFDDVFKERRAELACEGDYYFEFGTICLLLKLKLY